LFLCYAFFSKKIHTTQYFNRVSKKSIWIDIYEIATLKTPCVVVKSIKVCTILHQDVDFTFYFPGKVVNVVQNNINKYFNF
jgi:hypothetical protein